MNGVARQLRVRDKRYFYIIYFLIFCLAIASQRYD